jgi:hypothetical protein
MTWGDLGVGSLDDPRVHWDGGRYNDKLPLPLVSLGCLHLFGVVEAAGILKHKYGGKDLVWGGTGARLKRDEILAFVRSFESIDINAEWRRKAVEKVMTLNPDKTYLLYAYES